MFKLTVYEIKKIFTAGKSAAAVAALMLAAFIVCCVFAGKGVSYTKDQENEILRFDAVCAENPGALDGLEEKRQNRTAEIVAELWLRYAEELETASDKNAVDEKYEKIFDDPSTYYTYTYSEKIDDGALISAVKELQATRRAYADGVAAVLSQAERNAKELREKYGKRFFIKGGIDKHVLRRSRKEIRAELEYKMSAPMRGGGTIFALDHRIPNGTPIENYRYYVSLGRELLGLGPIRGEGWARMAF